MTGPMLVAVSHLSSSVLAWVEGWDTYRSALLSLICCVLYPCLSHVIDTNKDKDKIIIFAIKPGLGVPNFIVSV